MTTRRVAFYLAVHHKPQQLAWLLNAIHNPDDLFLLHVDAKSPAAVAEAAEALAASFANVRLLPRRSVGWGDWSQVSTELEAQKAALESDDGWSYFINLSGQDYPLVSSAELRAFLDGIWPRNDIRAWSFDRIRRIEPDDQHLARRRFATIAGRRVTLPLSLRRLSGIDLDYKGSQWHMLTREFCTWLRDDPVASRIAGVLKDSLIPDETFFQAAIMNSPFADQRTEDVHRFIVWPGPKTLGVSDLPAMLASGALFARKFDEDVDVEVLQALARRIGASEPAAARAR